MLVPGLCAAQVQDVTPSYALVQVDHDVAGIYRGEIRAADLDGDGRPDLVLYGAIDNFNELWGPTEDGKAAARVMVYFNRSSRPGTIRFAPGPVWRPGNGSCRWLDDRWCGELHTLDYDGDGDTDFVISGKGLLVFTNRGKGHFEPQRISRDGGHIAVADFNGDGRDDVMHTQSYYGKKREFSLSFDGGRWVHCGYEFDHNMGAGDLVAGDLDGDGWADIVVGGNTEQFGSHRASTKCFSQWHRNVRGRFEPDPRFFFSTLGQEKQHSTRQDGMDNGSYALADLNRDGHLDVIFSGSHAGFQGNWERPYWATPENPKANRKWIHYDFVTFIQTAPYDGRHFIPWEFNGGGPGCKRTSCVAAADATGDGYPEVVHIGHTSQRLLPPPYDLPPRRSDGFEGARRAAKGKGFYHAKYTPTIRVFENDGLGGLRYTYHETLTPVDYGSVLWVDLDGDKRRDLVYCGATRIFHTNCSDFLDRNRKNETIHTLIYRNVPPSEPRLVIAPVVESVEVGRQRDFRVIYHDGTGRSRDVTDNAEIRCANDHAKASRGKVRGASLGTAMVTAEFRSLKGHSVFHVFENPIKPLRDRWDTEHGGGRYLSVSPSSITMAAGAMRDGFVVTLHPEDGPVRTVKPTRVMACQPRIVTFDESRNVATGVGAGPAALAFVYRPGKNEQSDLVAVCYVTVTGERHRPAQKPARTGAGLQLLARGGLEDIPQSPFPAIPAGGRPVRHRRPARRDDAEREMTEGTPMKRKITRRTFLGGSAAGLGVTILGAGSARSYAANTKLNVAHVGCGGRGKELVGTFTRQANIVAMCDVNDARAAIRYREHPDVPKFKDFRVMLEKAGKQIDAVVVATPDHTHAVATAAAIRAGKGVYAEKPLTRTVGESRAVRELARKHKVATSMGNQGTGTGPYRRALELVQAGTIGQVKQVHVWCEGPGPSRLEPPTEAQKVPPYLAWDLWLGPARYRPFHVRWLGWHNWRGFGTGNLGNWASHSANLPFRALKVDTLWQADPKTKPIIKVKATPAAVSKVAFPPYEHAEWQIPARGDLPPITFTWCRGHDPAGRARLEAAMGRKLDWGDHGPKKWTDFAGCLLVGTKGTIYSTGHNASFTFLQAEKFKDVQRERPETVDASAGHFQDWLIACKGGKPAWANFDYAGLLNEFLQIANIATQMPDETLAYDPLAGKIVNNADADALICPPYRDGWSL